MDIPSQSAITLGMLIIPSRTSLENPVSLKIGRLDFRDYSRTCEVQIMGGGIFLDGVKVDGEELALLVWFVGPHVLYFSPSVGFRPLLHLEQQLYLPLQTLFLLRGSQN